ncbi:MAG: hypothetical protein CMH52_07480 [Myxococcales bacterium]|nr:hypothetical protein [Myxococcales bacterium]
MRLPIIVLICLIFNGCDDGSPASAGGDVGMGPADMATSVDGMTIQRFDSAPTPRDARVPLDAAQMPADQFVPLPDTGPAPDVGPLGGDPCDPRLNARACDPGFFCVHVPQQRPNVGRCQAGDGCRPGVEGDCPPDRPYCHLKGGSTVCTEAGALMEGDDCVDALDIPQPCAEGLVCNNSICQVPCIPGAENDCPNGGRCADISERVGVDAGLCGPRNCDWFTGDGCDDDEKCSYAIRSDGVLVGSCTALNGPGNPDGSMCSNLPMGGDNCAQGLVCIGAAGRERICRTLCDTGQYEAPCAGTRACEERLQTTSGVVRGYGLCVTNQ